MQPMADSPRTTWPRFALLLAMLALLMLTAPLAETLTSDLAVRMAALAIRPLFVAMLLSAVYAVSADRRAVIVGLTLTAPVLIAQLADLAFDRTETAVAGHLLSAAFLVYAIVIIVRWLFAARRVTVNMICASLCVYLLLGVLWSLGYSLLEIAEPASFAFPPSAPQSGPRMRFGGEQMATALYYSFVTLSTVGYGDITPVTAAARMLSVLESITGQLYLAVLVARLVGLHIAHEQR
jgi:hypothetical protein